MTSTSTYNIVMRNTKRKLEDDKKVGEAYRQYVLLNLKMNELVTLGAKG